VKDKHKTSTKNGRSKIAGIDFKPFTHKQLKIFLKCKNVHISTYDTAKYNIIKEQVHTPCQFADVFCSRSQR
jgi:hypothetical protein